MGVTKEDMRAAADALGAKLGAPVEMSVRADGPGIVMRVDDRSVREFDSRADALLGLQMALWGAERVTGQ